MKSHHKRTVLIRSENRMQKLDRGLLLEREPIADRTAGINHQTNTQWQVTFPAELHDGFGRLSIIQYGEVKLIQPFHKVPSSICDSENEVHLIDAGANCRERIAL